VSRLLSWLFGLGKHGSTFSSRSDVMFLVPMMVILGGGAIPTALATGEMLLQVYKMFPGGVVHDFGKVPSGTQAQHTFRVVNTSKVPLRIVSLRGS
jgi:hypothetical protein